MTGGYGQQSLAFGLGVLVIASASVAQTVTIRIDRQYPAMGCISGYLAIEELNHGLAIVYTLERPWVANIGYLSSIPDGTYDGVIRQDHSDLWRIELKDVPDRSNIQIHIGNYVSETEGCILVGDGLGADGCTLQGSASAYGKLRAAFAEANLGLEVGAREIKVKLSGGQRH